MVLSAAPERTPQQAYVEKYASVAVYEMYRSGVPASITLAQGLLESRHGLSELAIKGNNHFGIKCHNWAGKKMYHDDDQRGECFRVYKSANESFSDHSDFLRYRDRYKFLFDLDPKDYKGWAHGLKKAGYATDPAYPAKLIKLIEDYDLDQYDSKPASWAGKDENHQKPKKKGPKQSKEEPVEIPESPNSIEQARPYESVANATLHLSLTRQIYSLNGVPFIRAKAGETYESIASANNLFKREILKFNDLETVVTLEPGTVVFLQPKKNRAAKGLEKHIVEDPDETLRDIAQRYGVKLEKLCKMNGIPADRKLVEDEVIILR